MLLAPVIVWLVLRFREDGWRRWDAEVLLLAWLSPIAVIFAPFTGVSAAAPIILLLCAIIVRRALPAGVKDFRHRYKRRLGTASQRFSDLIE
jgi:hypothetical protein